ncbi:excinuclease ABC subunit B [Flavobacterium sp.]|uniref:excinuclease ABC subunit B n=1 Tax=Flavobacterium sp. TaxID=239 RepID=UPI0039E2B943
MNTHEEKISLLSEMIAFSIVDGRLHEREYEFLALVAEELGIAKETFDELFHTELPTQVIKSEPRRIQQFYRLALLMHIDGVLHDREQAAIRQIGINMGLNPAATKKILQAMEEAPNAIIDPDLLYNAFREQYN